MPVSRWPENGHGLSPLDAIASEQLRDQLKQHELAELKLRATTDSSLVYYIGHRAEPSQKRARVKDYIVDGGYILVQGDHLDFRYEVLESKAMGEGAHGSVYRVFDHKECSEVAVKVAKQTPGDSLSRVKREAEFLQWIHYGEPHGAGGIISLKGSFMFRGCYFLIFPLLPKSSTTGTLSRVAYNAAPEKRLSVTAVREIARQLMTALVCLGTKGLVHGDIKPDNVMLTEGFKVVLIDLGSALFVPSARARDEWSPRGAIIYKAPEALLEVEWGSAMDMWSVGCTLFHLITGEAPFIVSNRSSNWRDVLRLQVKMLGCPPLPLVARWREQWQTCSMRAGGAPSTFPAELLEQLQPTAQSRHGATGRELLCGKLERMAMTCPDDSVESMKQFLLATLDWDPKSRMTPGQALRHPFLSHCSPPGSVTLKYVLCFVERH